MNLLHPVCAGLLSLAASGADVATEVADESSWLGRSDARLSLSQLFTDDNVTPDHLLFSDVRARIDAKGILHAAELELHVNGRWRYGWTEVSKHRNDIGRLYFQYGNRKSSWLAAIGRQTLTAAPGARVDGGLFALQLGKGYQLGLFGGLRPHPIDASIDPRFRTAGLIYESRGKTQNHSAAVVTDWFNEEIDRLYASGRLYLSIGESWTLFGQSVIDFFSPSGILEGLDLRQRRDDFLSGLDLTHAHLRLRYRHSEWGDVTVGGSHVHTIVPNVWWRDWIREERARRGFAVEDGVEPVGTRRSSINLTGNLRLHRLLTPYVRVRYDRRHEDDEEGFEGRPGVKLRFGSTTWVDLYYRWRQHFSAINNQVALSGGTELFGALVLDVRASFMSSRPRGASDSGWLYDLGLAAHLRLGALVDSLDGIDAMGQYETFIERDRLFHVFFLRLGYRFRSDDA